MEKATNIDALELNVRYKVEYFTEIIRGKQVRFGTYAGTSAKGFGLYFRFEGLGPSLVNPDYIVRITDIRELNAEDN